MCVTLAAKSIWGDVKKTQVIPQDFFVLSDLVIFNWKTNFLGGFSVKTGSELAVVHSASSRSCQMSPVTTKLFP
jgi:hypothetical protein